jgi:hypothetical protein
LLAIVFALLGVFAEPWTAPILLGRCNYGRLIIITLDCDECGVRRRLLRLLMGIRDCGGFHLPKISVRVTGAFPIGLRITVVM